MQKMKETVLSNSSTFKGENGHERTINSVFLHSFESHLCFLSSQLGLLLLKKKKKKKPGCSHNPSNSCSALRSWGIRWLAEDPTNCKVLWERNPQAHWRGLPVIQGCSGSICLPLTMTLCSMREGARWRKTGMKVRSNQVGQMYALDAEQYMPGYSPLIPILPGCSGE